VLPRTAICILSKSPPFARLLPPARPPERPPPSIRNSTQSRTHSRRLPLAAGALFCLPARRSALSRSGELAPAADRSADTASLAPANG